MRYEIIVNGQMLMQVRYISDAVWFIRDRRSLGWAVVVREIATGRCWHTESADEIAQAATA